MVPLPDFIGGPNFTFDPSSLSCLSPFSASNCPSPSSEARAPPEEEEVTVGEGEVILIKAHRIPWLGSGEVSSGGESDSSLAPSLAPIDERIGEQEPRLRPRGALSSSTTRAKVRA